MIEAGSLRAEVQDDLVEIKVYFPVSQKDLAVWWMRTTQQDLMAASPKIEEYGGADEGSADLEVMGDAQAKLLGWRDVPQAVVLELACWFYALGKIARLISDYRQHRAGKPDTWHDLTVYSLMARRIRETGRWP